MDSRLEQLSEQDAPRRPMLTDPKEYALIKKIHFSPQLPQDYDNADIDPLERWDRLQHRTNRNTSR